MGRGGGLWSAITGGSVGNATREEAGFSGVAVWSGRMGDQSERFEGSGFGPGSLNETPVTGVSNGTAAGGGLDC